MFLFFRICIPLNYYLQCCVPNALYGIEQFLLITKVFNTHRSAHGQGFLLNVSYLMYS